MLDLHGYQVRDQKLELARLETMDMGKPIDEAEWDMVRAGGACIVMAVCKQHPASPCTGSHHHACMHDACMHDNITIRWGMRANCQTWAFIHAVCVGYIWPDGPCNGQHIRLPTLAPGSNSLPQQPVADLHHAHA